MIDLAKIRRTVTKNDIAGFAAFCRLLQLENGRPLRLYPEQKTMLGDYFDGVRETLILISKKNGKTTLLAALALYHLLTTKDASCVIGAASRDQATILYDQATGLIERSELSQLFKSQKGYRRVDARWDLGRIRVLAADENTADGVIPTLALVDELHRHKNGGLYGVFRDGLGPRSGRLVTISTAGANLDSPLGVLRARAYELPDFSQEGVYRHVRTPEFAMHEWALPPDGDVDDLEQVVKANPAPWQTITQLRMRHDSPSMTPGQWQRFACGVWTEGEEPWLNPALWDKLAQPGLELDPDAPTWIGVDVGVRKDSTAIVTATATGDGEVAVKARILRPPSDGGGLPLQVVEEAVRQACADRNVRSVLFDPWTFRRSAELLQMDGLPMTEFPQSPEHMANASENLYRLITTEALVHAGDPAFRAHVVAGAVKQTERGWRLVKDPRSARPIDALIALAMAALPAAQNLVREPSFAWG